MNWITDFKIPIGPWAKIWVDWLTSNGEWFFNELAFVLSHVINGLLFLLQEPVSLALLVAIAVIAYYASRSILVAVLAFALALAVLILGYLNPLFAIVDQGMAAIQAPPGLLLIVLMTAFSWWLRRSIGITLFTLLGLLLIMNQGYWKETTQTLALVLASTFVSMIVGIPLGIAGARRAWIYAFMRPVLDLMQTIPTFVYLIPALILFGLGMVPGLIATVIFAIPAPIRLTRLGIISTPPSLVEAAESFGATPVQVLRKVELPFAMPQIMAGMTQTIMLSLSMVVIAALVGADGLGVPVVRALNTVNIAKGFEAGLCIVILAIILDRMFKTSGEGEVA